MKQMIAHILGLDKVLIRERERSTQLEWSLIDARSRCKQLEEANKELVKELQDKTTQIESLEYNIRKWQNEAFRMKDATIDLSNELTEKKKKIASLNGKCGAYVKQINEWRRAFEQG